MESLLFIVACVATVLYGVKLLMSMIGLGGDHDISGHDVHISHDYSDQALRFVSLDSILAFFMGFGWSALTFLKSTWASTGMAVLCGVLVGCVFGLISVGLMACLKHLREENINKVEDCIDAVGTVYNMIPKDGSGVGRVQLWMRSGVRELPAVTFGSKDLTSGMSVQVKDILADKVSVVEYKQEENV